MRSTSHRARCPGIHQVRERSNSPSCSFSSPFFPRPFQLKLKLKLQYQTDPDYSPKLLRIPPPALPRELPTKCYSSRDKCPILDQHHPSNSSRGEIICTVHMAHFTQGFAYYQYVPTFSLSHSIEEIDLGIRYSAWLFTKNPSPLPPPTFLPPSSPLPKTRRCKRRRMPPSNISGCG